MTSPRQKKKRLIIRRRTQEASQLNASQQDIQVDGAFIDTTQVEAASISAEQPEAGQAQIDVLDISQPVPPREPKRKFASRSVKTFAKDDPVEGVPSDD